MTQEWTNWAEVGWTVDPDGSGTSQKQWDPYVDWALHGPGETDIDTTNPGGARFRLATHTGSGATVPGGCTVTGTATHPAPQLKGLKDPLPVPRHAANPCDLIFPARLPDPADLPAAGEIANDTVIAGVVDVGIPLGHRRFRLADGKTRILSAWQMMARFDASRPWPVPFGQSLLAGEIDALLQQHSGNQQNGILDEQAFNIASGGLLLDVGDGPKSLASRGAHGAHVLDATAGASTGVAAEQAMQDRTRIIAVNAPSASIFGAGGTYLEQYLFHALHYIIQTADAVWMKQNPTPPAGARQGYPIVINMSFGRQAGSTDYFNTFTEQLRHIQDYRTANNLSPVYFVMPVGNDNLTQSNAFLEPEPGGTETLDWRIPPQDQSSNFTEIWCDDDPAAATPIQLNLTHPGGTVSLPPPPDTLEKTAFSDLKLNGQTVARVYVTRLKLDMTADTSGGGPATVTVHKLRYILCVAPTYRPAQVETRIEPSAPAGHWKISTANTSTAKRTCTLSIQSDQYVTPRRSINLRSSFEHAAYRAYDEMGRLVESYSYPPDATNHVTNTDLATDTPIRRHGTALASSGADFVAQLAGYRGTDGRPGPYSSTGRGRRNGEDDGTTVPSPVPAGLKGRRAPTAALPTDDGAAHYGILAGGSFDGTVIAQRGTSFASSQGARVVIEYLLDGGTLTDIDAIFELLGQAAEAASPYGAPRPAALEEVLGWGRLPSPLSARVPRM